MIRYYRGKIYTLKECHCSWLQVYISKVTSLWALLAFYNKKDSALKVRARNAGTLLFLGECESLPLAHHHKFTLKVCLQPSPALSIS